MVVLQRAALLFKRCLPNQQQTSSFHTNFVNSGFSRVASTSPHIASSLQQTARTTSSSSSTAAAVRTRLIQFLTGHFPILALVTPSARPIEHHVHRSIRYAKIIHGLNFASKPFAKAPLHVYGRPVISGVGPVSTTLNASRSFTSAPAFANPVMKKAAVAFRQQASSLRPLANLTHGSSDLERNASEKRTLKVRRGVVCETQNGKRFNPIRRPAGQLKRKPISQSSVASSRPVSPNESVCEPNDAEEFIIPRVCATFSDIAEFVPRSDDDQLVQVYLSLLLYGPMPWDDAVQCMSTSKSFSGDLTPTALSASVVRNIADVVDFQTFHLRSVTRILQRIADCSGDANAFRVERHGCELRVLFPRGCPIDRVRRGLIAMGIEPDSAHFTLEMDELAAELRTNVWKEVESGLQENMTKDDTETTVPEIDCTPLDDGFYPPEVNAWKDFENAQTVGKGNGGFDAPNYLKGVNDFLTSVDEMDSVHFDRMPILTYSRATLALNDARSIDEFTNEWN